MTRKPDVFLLSGFYSNFNKIHSSGNGGTTAVQYRAMRRQPMHKFLKLISFVKVH